MYSAQNIAQGNYQDRVPVLSKDVLGAFSQIFNQMAGAVKNKINKLEDNNHEKQRFIDNLTHELKTPLTLIIGYSNLLRTAKVTDDGSRNNEQ